MQNLHTTGFEAITWWPIEISVKFQNRLTANQGSPIGWSRDQWSRVVTWPAFWKLGIAYAHSAYDYARQMWIAVEKQCALPVGVFSRYSNLIFIVLEVWWRSYNNSALNFEEVLALIMFNVTLSLTSSGASFNPAVARDFLHTYVAIGGGGKLPPGVSRVLSHLET